MTEMSGVPDEGLEIRTYFVRERNALVARADFGDLYVDYYLHQGQYGFHHRPAHDQLMKEALAALALHCASRPWNESTAWTIHLADPLVNLFVAGDNRLGNVVGQIFTENVKTGLGNLFNADVVRGSDPLRRSTVNFEGSDMFRAVEAYYRQSEQRPARYFRHAEEDFVMITAQPDCDVEWLESLTDEAVRQLDQAETLSLLEQRRYHWECGCNQKRMMDVLVPVMKRDPEALFGDEVTLRISCPRCGAQHTITREAMEAHTTTTTE